MHDQAYEIFRRAINTLDKQQRAVCAEMDAALARKEAFYSELLERSHRREDAMFVNGIGLGMSLVCLAWTLAELLP